MGGGRTPGSTCVTSSAPQDAGTSCLDRCPTPSSLGTGTNGMIGRVLAKRPLTTAQLSDDDIRRILRHLALNGFAVGPGITPLFGGKSVTLDTVVDRARLVVFSAVPREQVAAVVQAEWS